jgi:hypothetical protein
MKNAVCFFLLSIILLTACSRDKSPMRPASDELGGAYSCASYDSSERVIARGWLALSFADSATIAGEWHISKKGAMSDNKFDGTWTWVTIAGPTSSGRFTAIKR